MTRPLKATIDGAALRHNLATVRALADGAKVMAIVKADGYGHGLERVAAALAAADGFGLASLEEALRLRAVGVTQPLFLLEGFFEADELPLLARHRITSVIHHEYQLELLEASPLARELSIWIKLDTGMHRVGFAPEQLEHVMARVGRVVEPARIGLMSHFANADDPDDAYTERQLDRFLGACGPYANPRSIANSAGLVAWPKSRLEWVRPGIMLYGPSPLLDAQAGDVDLRPVMKLESRLISVNHYRRGDPVGYGGVWICPEDMPVGVVACGYGDGYPRHAPSGTPVAVNGVRVPLVGRVSMDMITVDLRDAPGARVGDPVVLWGDDPGVAEVASHAGTIAYELLCHVTPRVPRVETGGGD